MSKPVILGEDAFITEAPLMGSPPSGRPRFRGAAAAVEATAALADRHEQELALARQARTAQIKSEGAALLQADERRFQQMMAPWNQELEAVFGDTELTAAQARKRWRDQQKAHERDRRLREAEDRRQRLSNHRRPPHTARTAASEGARMRALSGASDFLPDLNATTSSTARNHHHVPQPPGTARTTVGSSAASRTGITASRRANESVVLPALGVPIRSYVATTLDRFRKEPELHEEFVRERRREASKAAAELREAAVTDVAHVAESARDPTLRGAQAEARRAQQNAARSRRRRKLEADKEKIASRHVVAETRRKAAAESKAHHEEHTLRVQTFLVIVKVAQATSFFARHSSLALALCRKRWRQIAYVAMAGFWLNRARRSLRHRKELQANIILGRQLPEALLRVRRRMYGPNCDLLCAFARHVMFARQLPSVVSQYMRHLRKSQSIFRRHLAARRMWHTAMLMSWQRQVEENILRQYDATYPRDPLPKDVFGEDKRSAVAVVSPLDDDDDDESSGAIKGSASSGTFVTDQKTARRWDSRLPKPQILADAAVNAIVRHRAVARAAVKEFGLNNYGDAVVCPNPSPRSLREGHDANGRAAGPPRLPDTVHQFVPASLRVRVVKAISGALAHQHARRLIMAERRRKEGKTSEPLPKLHRFVDRASMRRLVALVENKLAQQLAHRDLLVDEEQRRAAARRGMSVVDLEAAKQRADEAEAQEAREDSEVGAIMRSATMAMHEAMAEEQMHEASLRAPKVADGSPNRGDAAVARDVLDSLIRGQAPPFAPVLSDSSFGHFGSGVVTTESSPGSLNAAAHPASPLTLDCKQRRRRLQKMNELQEVDAQRSDDARSGGRAAARGVRVPMAMSDAAAELHDVVADSVPPATLAFVRNYAGNF